MMECALDPRPKVLKRTICLDCHTLLEQQISVEDRKRQDVAHLQ